MMLLTNLSSKGQMRGTLVGHVGRQLSENLGQTAVHSGGQQRGEENQEEREKCHFKSAGNEVRKRIGFLCLLLYVWD